MFKRYKSLFEKKTLKGVDVIEFFVKNNKLFIIYNDKAIHFKDFWNTYEKDTHILYKVYQLLNKRYPSLIYNIKTTITNKNDWKTVLLNFINLHWNKLNNIYDVLRHDASGETDFNLER